MTLAAAATMVAYVGLAAVTVSADRETLGAPTVVAEELARLEARAVDG